MSTPKVLYFVIDEYNFVEVDRQNPAAIPNLEKALVALGLLPAESYKDGAQVIYSFTVHYPNFSVDDIIDVFNKFGLRAIPTGSKSPIDSETMTLENAFGSVKAINRPEDFKKLREIALEEHQA